MPIKILFFLLTIAAGIIAFFHAAGFFTRRIVSAVTDSERLPGPSPQEINPMLLGTPFDPCDKGWFEPQRIAVMLPASMYCVLELWMLGPSAWPYWVTTCALAVLALVDFETGCLPSDILTAVLWSGLLASLLGLTHLTLPISLIGAIAGAAIMWIPAVLLKMTRDIDVLGDGDVHLMSAIGAWFGPLTVALAAAVAIPVMMLFASMSRMTAENRKGMDEAEQGRQARIQSLSGGLSKGPDEPAPTNMNNGPGDGFQRDQPPTHPEVYPYGPALVSSSLFCQLLAGSIGLPG